MILSHRHRFVILAAWKCASSTVHLRLRHLNESPYDRFFAFNPHLNRVVHQHLTCAEFFALPESRLGYRLAAFVRNPYDRVYSGFLQLQRDLECQSRMDFREPWIGTLVRQQLSENFAQLSAAAFDFDAWVTTLEEHQIREVGRNTNFPLHPAHYWTHVGGLQHTAFVGRVENFEADFTELCARLGVSPSQCGNANVSNSVADLQNGSRYVGRMKPASITRINGLFGEDFALFGYSMIEPNRNICPMPVGAPVSGTDRDVEVTSPD